MTTNLIPVFFTLLFALFVPGCAEMQPPVAAAGGAGAEKTIAVKASSFAFSPNNIRAVQGDTVVFTITNVSGSTHNFTITDPQGRTLTSADLPENGTVAVTVTLDEPGKYVFYCDKPFHSAFGMKGRIEAAAR